jgi:cytochrome c2
MLEARHVAISGLLSALLVAACSTTPSSSTPEPTTTVQSPAAAVTSEPSQPAAQPAQPASVTASTSAQAAVGTGDAKQGKSLYTAKGCNGCHTIGKGKSAGPDLKGVVSKRDGAWLRAWLKDSPAMAKTDPVAIAMVAEYKGMVMPKMGLTDAQIEHIIAYLAGA